MSYTPTDDEIIWDIVRAGRRLATFTAGIQWDAFLDDELRQSAVIRQIEIIGEACRRLSMEFRAAHHEIAWTSIIGMRNILIHAYTRVNLDDVWRVATRDAPQLIRLLEPLLVEPGDDP